MSRQISVRGAYMLENSDMFQMFNCNLNQFIESVFGFKHKHMRWMQALQDLPIDKERYCNNRKLSTSIMHRNLRSLPPAILWNQNYYHFEHQTIFATRLMQMSAASCWNFCTHIILLEWLRKIMRIINHIPPCVYETWTCVMWIIKVKLSLCFNWAPRHEGALGEWWYSSTNSWPQH
jgi:hypothetical protein